MILPKNLPKITVQKIETLAGHQDCIYSLEKLPEKHLFLSSGGDGKIALWNLKNPELGRLVAQIPSSVYAMRYFPQENALIVGQNFEGLQMIYFDENSQENSEANPEANSEENPSNYIPNKEKNKSLKTTKSQIFDIQIVDNQENNQKKYSAFVAQGDGVLTIVDLTTFAVKKHIQISINSLRKIAVSPLNNEFAVASSDNFIRIFDLQTLQLKQEIEAHISSVFSLRYFSNNQDNNSNLLISGSRDAHLKIWEKTTDNSQQNSSYTLKTDIIAHLFAINDIDFSPCGNYFATCSMDKSIKIWDSKTFSLLKVIDKARNASHATSVNKILWSDYEDYIISASDDKFISVWGINAE